MSDQLLHVLTVVAALGCALVGGVFFAFSTFVMKALDRLPPPQGLVAMQSINVTVINGLFMTAFFGTAAACVLLVIVSLLAWHRPGAGFLFFGSVLYLLGTILVTIVFNVPRNNTLAAVHPANGDSARAWAGYVKGWTVWNHVRTVAAVVAAAALMIALRH